MSVLPEPVRILGVDVHPLDVDGLHAYIGEVIRAGGHSLVLNVNAHALNLGCTRPWLREFWNEAPVVFCDGAGVRLAARMLGVRLPPRITYADWMWQLGAEAERREWSLYLLGGEPGVAPRATRRMRARFPDLRVVGARDGYFDKTAGCAASRAVVEEINRVAPDILVVGFGMPLQEAWLRDHWDAIDARIALTGGAALDYVSGKLVRAPRWMTRNGLEWLGRLAIEPRRLWRRYLLGNPSFLWRISRQKLTGAEP